MNKFFNWLERIIYVIGMIIIGLNFDIGDFDDFDD